MPGPVDWVVPAVVASNPLVAANPTGSACRTSGKASTAGSSGAVSAAVLASTCQSTATPATSRRVIVAFDAETKAPIEASRATATATPPAAAPRRPRRRVARAHNQVRPNKTHLLRDK